MSWNTVKHHFVTTDGLENFDKDLDVDANDNKSCWIQLADGKSMVELADLAKSPGGDEFSCVYYHDSSNSLNEDKFKDFMDIWCDPFSM